MRTFIALELPKAFEDEVVDLARQLSGMVQGRFMKRETYHLTLAFLGEIGEAESRDVIAVLDEVADACDVVTLRPTGLGTFGKPRECALWLGLAQTDELMTLADELPGVSRGRHRVPANVLQKHALAGGRLLQTTVFGRAWVGSRPIRV